MTLLIIGLVIGLVIGAVAGVVWLASQIRMPF